MARDCDGENCGICFPSKLYDQIMAVIFPPLYVIVHEYRKTPKFKDMVNIFKNMPSLGYSKQTCEKAIMLIRGNYPRAIVAAKANGLKVDVTLIKKFIKCYKGYASFWTIDLIILVIPSKVFKVFKFIRKVIA